LREKIPLLAGLGAVIAVSFGFSIMAEVRTLDAEREVLLAELATTTHDVFGEETSDPEKARELLDPASAGSDEDPMPRVDAFDVMVALSKAVPKEVVHDVVSLDVSRGHVLIEATVPTNKDAEAIADKMKENKCFKDVKIPRTNQFGDAASRLKYVLEFDLKCEEKKKKPADGAPGSASATPGAGKTDDAKTDGGR
jgi:general secretion pathway protein L